MAERSADDVLSKYGAGTERAKKAATPAKSADDVLGKYGAGAKGKAAAEAKKKRPGLLRQVTDLAGQVPRGIVGAVGEAGRELTTIANVDTANPIEFVKSSIVGKKRRPEERPQGAVEGLLALAGANPRQGARPGETAKETMARTRPFSTSTAESIARTAGDVRHPSRLVDAAKEGTIVAKVLEDVANLATVGRAGSVAAKAAGAPTVAKVLDAPGAAGRAAGRAAVAPVKNAAKAAYQATATGEGRVAQTLQTLKLDPNSRLLRTEAIEPAAEKVSEGVGAAVKRGETVAKVLPDLDEQRAMTLVGEGEAPALAKLRANLPADEFDAHLARTYGDAVPRKAVDLAADVAEGKAPELAARIDEGLRLGRELPGGRADRSAAYLAAKPSREAQAGFDPLPQVVEQRLKPLRSTQKRADVVAGGARAKADRAAAELAEAEAGERRPGPRRATAGLEQAAMRVQSARARLAEAKKAAGAAEDEIMAKAAARAERAARAGVRSEVLTYRRQAQAHARAMAADMEAGVIPDRPAPVPRASAMHDVAEQFREGLGAHFANRRFFSSDGGIDLDVWLEHWNARRNVVPEISSGEDYARVAADAVAHFRTVRELRSAANGVVSRGAEGRALVHLMEDPEADLYLRGTPDEAVGALVGERGPLAPDAGSDALAAAYGRIDTAAGAPRVEKSADAIAERYRAKGAAVDVSERDGSLTLHRIVVPAEARNQGVGSEFMRELVAYADATGKRIDLTPSADFGGSKARLVEFYKRHGFVPNKGRTRDLEISEDMYRPAGPKPAGAKLRPLERRIAAAEGAAPTVSVAEAKLGTAREATTAKLLDAGARAGLPLGRAQMKARVTEAVARSAERRRSTLAGHLEAARRDVEHSIDAAPARLRPVLKANREAASLLTQAENRLRAQGMDEAARLAGKAADELAVTLPRLKAAGVDFDHFTHIRLDAKPSTGAQPGALPKIRKGREERRRKGSTAYDRTVRAQTQAEIDQVKIAVAREAVERIRTLPFARRFDSIESATKEGYVAWDPASPFEKAGQITGTTVFVPAKLHEHFRSYFLAPGWDKLLKRTYDPAIQAFKVTVLPLSPSWQVGNVFGNALLATVGGGVGPIDLATQLTRAVKAYRASGPRGERNFEAVGPRRLYTAGPTHEEFSFLRAPDEMVLGDGKASSAVRAVAKPGAKVVRASYALNGFVDNLGRSAVYLSKLNKGATPDQALRASLRAMGDFSRMTSFERRVVRRVIPFYAWQRHLTQLAFRLPVEHPMRMAWTLHLADMFGRDESIEDLPEFLRGAIPLPGGRLLGTRGLNPFSQVGGPVLSPGDALRNLSPALKIPLEAYTGVDTLDGRPFSRPPGTGRLDEFGRELPTAPGLAKRITDISPQKRLLESLQGRGRVVRYDTGDPVITATGPIESERTPQQGLLRFLGFPLTSRAEAERIAAQAADKEAEAAKRRAVYERRRRAAAKR